jgi:hypothetical protein
MIFRWAFKTNDDKIHSIDFELYDNELVHAWKKIFSFSDDNHTHFYGIYSEEDKNNDIDLLKKNYLLIEPYLEDKDKNIDFTNIDNHLLNKLHRIFHYYSDRYHQGSNIFDKLVNPQKILEILNVTIHRVETPANNDCVMGVFVARTKQSVDIPEDWYNKYFRDTPNHGDLLLGYATVGKELKELYFSNDHENLNSISPQRKIREEFRIFIREKDYQDSTEENSIQWAKTHGYINLKDSEKYSQRPRLGKLRTQISFKELRDLFANYKEFYSWTFLEE